MNIEIISISSATYCSDQTAEFRHFLSFKALVLGSSPSPLTSPTQKPPPPPFSKTPTQRSFALSHERCTAKPTPAHSPFSLLTILVVENPSTVGTISTRPPAAITSSCPTTVSTE